MLAEGRAKEADADAESHHEQQTTRRVRGALEQSRNLCRLLRAELLGTPGSAALATRLLDGGGKRADRHLSKLLDSMSAAGSLEDLVAHARTLFEAEVRPGFPERDSGGRRDARSGDWATPLIAGQILLESALDRAHDRPSGDLVPARELVAALIDAGARRLMDPLRRELLFVAHCLLALDVPLLTAGPPDMARLALLLEHVQTALSLDGAPFEERVAEVTHRHLLAQNLGPRATWDEVSRHRAARRLP